MTTAMNKEMWAKPAVQRNVAQLTGDGVQMIGPATAGKAAANAASAA